MMIEETRDDGDSLFEALVHPPKKCIMEFFEEIIEVFCYLNYIPLKLKFSTIGNVEVNREIFYFLRIFGWCFKVDSHHLDRRRLCNAALKHQTS